MTNKQRIAIYGGAFNPPHVGHVMTVMWLLTTRLVDRVWVMPSFHHPFGKDMASFEDRFKMCEEVFDAFEDVFVKPDEKQNESGITFDLISKLRNRYSEEFEFSLVIGSDNWAARKKWKKWDQLVELVDDVIVAGRGDSEFTGIINICNVSSTDIRKAIKDKSVYVGEDEVYLTHALPSCVLDYIIEERLYGCTTKLEEQLDER